MICRLPGKLTNVVKIINYPFGNCFFFFFHLFIVFLGVVYFLFYRQYFFVGPILAFAKTASGGKLLEDSGKNMAICFFNLHYVGFM